jgi:hypothetical protein
MQALKLQLAALISGALIQNFNYQGYISLVMLYKEHEDILHYDLEFC